jgi:hypothetical protein
MAAVRFSSRGMEIETDAEVVLAEDPTAAVEYGVEQAKEHWPTSEDWGYTVGVKEVQ